MAQVGVWLNCAECGEDRAYFTPANQTLDVVSCRSCGAGIDRWHAFGHAPWCVSCGEDINDCVCEERFVCDQCGAECGLICRVCAVCPEPAGYWAWSDATMAAYLDALDAAADSESDPGIAQTLIAHRAVMSEGWDPSVDFDMDVLASKLSDRGIPSHVAMTGGGVATLFGGEVVGRDEFGSDKYTLVIGPGTYGYGVGRSFGSWDELAYGADDDGETCAYWDGPKDLDRFVDWVVFHMPRYREAMTRYMETIRTEGSGAE